MSNARFLKFGPEPMYRTVRGRAYIYLGDAGKGARYSNEILVGSEHDSLSEFKAELENIRRDLEEAERQAESYFAGRAHD